MNKFTGRVGYYYFYTVFITLFLIFFPVQWALLQRKAWYGMAHSYRRFCARIILFVGGIRYKVVNPQFLHSRQPYIICANHSSNLDIMVFCAVFKKYTVFMAKIELTNIPLFGIYFKTIDIQVDRKNSENGAAAYRKAVRVLEAGNNLVIYPEGGILPDPLLVKPFKDGAFQLAIRHKVAILPVGLPDNYKIMPDTGNIANPGKIRIILHEPLQTADLKISDMDSLKDELKNIIQKDLLA